MSSVAIIGGGVSGLICIKCCLDAGLTPICYEMTNDIGGLWNYDANAIDGKASVMKSTVINTSKEFMAFSDYPPPEEFPNYMHNTKLLAYFRMYAEHFRLKDYIRFERKITKIEPADDYEQTGAWMVSSINAISHNDEKMERHDNVMLATGHHAHPRSPNFPGFDQFKGQKLHSWQYKTSKGFEDKNVLVIGIGNSGGDLAVELGRVAKQVYLSTRRGTWVFNRVGPNGIPADMSMITELAAVVQQKFPNFTNWLMEKNIGSRFNHELYGLKPKHRPLQQHPFLNDDLANRIICGSVVIKPNVREFSDDGFGVTFDDGSHIDQIDCVLMATGFNIAFPYINKEILPVEQNHVRLYKYVWPANMKHSTLAVMGLIQPWGAINPITELQARWAVRVFNGTTKLPSKFDMEQDIESKARRMAERYVASARHTVQVDYIEYCNEIAEQVGCRPNIFRYLLTDFPLGWSLLFEGCTPYRYRLEGPNAWKGARQAILTQFQRVQKAFDQGRSSNNRNQSIVNSPFFWLLAVLLIISIIISKLFF